MYPNRFSRGQPPNRQGRGYRQQPENVPRWYAPQMNYPSQFDTSANQPPLLHSPQGNEGFSNNSQAMMQMCVQNLQQQWINLRERQQQEDMYRTMEMQQQRLMERQQQALEQQRALEREQEQRIHVFMNQERRREQRELREEGIQQAKLRNHWRREWKPSTRYDQTVNDTARDRTLAVVKVKQSELDTEKPWTKESDTESNQATSSCTDEAEKCSLKGKKLSDNMQNKGKSGSEKTETEILSTPSGSMDQIEKESNKNLIYITVDVNSQPIEDKKINDDKNLNDDSEKTETELLSTPSGSMEQIEKESNKNLIYITVDENSQPNEVKKINDDKNLNDDSEKTETEILSTPSGSMEQIEKESNKNLIYITVDENSQPNEDKKINDNKKLKDDTINNKVMTSNKLRKPFIQCEIEHDVLTNSKEDRGSSNDFANAEMPESSAVAMETEVKDRYTLDVNDHNTLISLKRNDEQSKPNKINGGSNDDDAIYKEEINETETQLEKLTLTPNKNADSESIFSKEDLETKLSDPNSSDLRDKLSHNDDDNRKVKHFDGTDTETVKEQEHDDKLNLNGGFSKGNADTCRNVDNSEEIPQQQGQYTVNNREQKPSQNTNLEDSSVERIPVTSSAPVETKTNLSDKQNLSKEQASACSDGKHVETPTETVRYVNDIKSAINTSNNINSIDIETESVSNVEHDKANLSGDIDIDKLAGRISGIFSESGNKEQYEVIVEDISDDEKSGRAESEIESNSQTKSTHESGKSGTSFIEKSVEVLHVSSLSPNSRQKRQSGLNGNNETERSNKSITEEKIILNEKIVQDDAYPETSKDVGNDVSESLKLNNDVTELKVLDDKTADGRGSYQAKSSAEIEVTDEKKSYLEYMEVEDISPPLSVALDTFDSTSINETVGNSSETGVDKALSCDRSSVDSVPSDLKMKSGTYQNIFTLLENDISETTVGSIPVNEAGDSNLASLNVKDNSETSGAGQDDTLLPDLVDKESKDLHLHLEENNDGCRETPHNGMGKEDENYKVNSADRNGTSAIIASPDYHLDGEKMVSRSESPENEGIEQSDSEIKDNTVSSSVVHQVKAGSNDSPSSIESITETVNGGGQIEQQKGRHLVEEGKQKGRHPDEEGKEDSPPSREADFSIGEESDGLEADSDNDLFDVPAFLHSVKDVSEQPLPSTPEFSTQSQDSNTDNNEAPEGNVNEKTIKSTLRSRFSLDDLLMDKEKSTGAEQLRLEKIHSECKKDIAEGGFITILDRVDEEGTEETTLSEEKQEILNQLTVVESKIREDRPGQLVFDKASYCCLFGCTIHPAHCGFTVGGGKFIEKHLHSLKLSQYERLVNAGLIQIGFEKIECKEQLLRWLFFLMSIHSDYLIRHGCHRVLMDVLHAQQLAGKQKWAPAIADVLSVFVNYGASLHSLYSSASLPQVQATTQLFSQPGYTAPADHSSEEGYDIDNLLLVLEVLAYSLKDNSFRYSSSELTLFLTVLMKASLDTKLESFCAFDAFCICVGNVIRQYTQTDWNTQKIPLSRLISEMSSHHHDQLVLAKLLPLDTRGSYLQRRTGYLMLEHLCSVSERLNDDELHNFKIQNLYPFVGCMKEMVHTDPYQLSSVISLLDLAVGHGTKLTQTDREELRNLMDLVKRVSGEVRDNVRMLDRTRVKDMMFRMANRWSLNIQAIRGKQSKMFEFVKPDSRREIQTVQTVQSNDESEDSDSNSTQDSESEDQEEGPCKMPRLEPYYFSPNVKNPVCAAGNEELDNSVVRSDSSAGGSNDSAMRLDNSAVRSNGSLVRSDSKAVRNLSEHLMSDEPYGTTMNNGDSVKLNGANIENNAESNSVIDDHPNVEIAVRADILDGSQNDQFDSQIESPLAGRTETSMDYEDELPEL